MSKLHEIQAHVSSVRSTKKVTRAMYLTAASQTQRAKQMLASTKPYFQQITATMSETVVPGHTIDTPYFDEGKSTANIDLYLVLGSDKGMAGGYTHNMLVFLDECIPDKASAMLMVAGAHGRSKIRRAGYRVDHDFAYPVMNPSLRLSRELAELLIEKYFSGNYREIYLVFTKMITPLQQKPEMMRILPLRHEMFAEQKPASSAPPGRHMIKYEPSARKVFDHLVPHYLKGIIYSAFVEAFASEQNVRMLSMDNATKSADEMISKLTLQYNRERQAEITQELIEVVSGIPTE